MVNHIIKNSKKMGKIEILQQIDKIINTYILEMTRKRRLTKILDTEHFENLKKEEKSELIDHITDETGLVWNLKRKKFLFNE